MRNAKTKPIKIQKVDGFIQMHEGTWYALESPQIDECCDCGLVHHTEFMLEKGRLFWRAAVDKKATAAARERDNIKVTKNGKTDLS
jgi:hypothetical protein